MKIVKIVALSLAVIILVGAIVIFIAFLIGQQPTHGQAIGIYSEPRKALLIIDVQEDYTGATARAPFPYPRSDTLIARINAIISLAQQRGFIICYIGQELPNGPVYKLMTGNRGIAGTPGAKLDRRLNVISENYFPKMYADAFSNKDLERFLLGSHVNEVFLCGLDAVHCVDATARGAANRGYRSVVIGGAIATMSSKPMNEILDGYQRHGVETISSENFCKD